MAEANLKLKANKSVVQARGSYINAFGSNRDKNIQIPSWEIFDKTGMGKQERAQGGSRLASGAGFWLQIKFTQHL